MKYRTLPPLTSVSGTASPSKDTPLHPTEDMITDRRPSDRFCVTLGHEFSHFLDRAENAVTEAKRSVWRRLVYSGTKSRTLNSAGSPWPR